MRDVSEPRWVRIIALGSTLALASFGAVGLLLADFGVYKPVLVLVLGLAAFIALFGVARRVLDVEGEVSSTDRMCAIVAVALSAIDRDLERRQRGEARADRPRRRSLHERGEVDRDARHALPPPAGRTVRQQPDSHRDLDRHEAAGHHLEFDLSHMLSAVLAEAQNLGGNRLMFLAVPLLSGVALLAFYLLAARLLAKSIAALAATLSLALLMPQVAFSRDSTTEIPIQVLLFTAMWLLCDRRTLRNAGPAFATGLLLGLVQAMHVDGLAFLVGLPAVYAITWLHSNRARARQAEARHGLVARRRRRRHTFRRDRPRALGSLLPLDRERQRRATSPRSKCSPSSARSPLCSSYGGPICSRRSERVRLRIAEAAGAVVVVGAFAAWFLRPSFQHVHAGPNATVALVQRFNGLPIDATKRYSEYTMHWIAWYIGPITLTLAIVGFAGLVIFMLRGSLTLPTQIATFMLAPPALLYIWRPTITPDQIWAARRFPARGVPRRDPVDVRSALPAAARRRTPGSSPNGARSRSCSRSQRSCFPGSRSGTSRR